MIFDFPVSNKMIPVNMKVNFATIREIQDVLMSKIFCYQNAESYLFDDGTYAVLPGDLGLLIRRNYIDWNNMNPKRKYSIIPHESGFIFRTYENEIYPGKMISLSRSTRMKTTLMPLHLNRWGPKRNA